MSRMKLIYIDLEGSDQTIVSAIASATAVLTGSAGPTAVTAAPPAQALPPAEPSAPVAAPEAPPVPRPRRKAFRAATPAEREGQEHPARLGRKARPVVNLDTHERYPSAKAADQAVGSNGGVAFAIRTGGRCKGHRWAYADDARNQAADAISRLVRA